MSEEQEAAAKWRMFEEYKQLDATYGALASKARTWGSHFNRLSGMANDPKIILGMDLSQLPNKEDVVAVQEEMRNIITRQTALKEDLRRAGMDKL